ncbi:MAG: EamA family transporter [Caulobacter sp.]|nr:EamA family transporter [Caulobacter sp.]
MWGINNVAAKVATEVLPPLFVGGVRFVLAFAFLAFFLRPPFPPWRTMLPIVLFSGPLHFSLVYLGFSMAKSFSPFVISLQLWIPFTALFAWRILGETMRPAAIAGLAVAFAGVAAMSLDPKAFLDVPAILLGLAASAMWGFATVMMRRTPSLKPLKTQAMTAIVTAPTLLGASFLFEPHAITAAQHAGPIVWGAAVWAGCVSTLGATGLLFWLVQRREPGRVTPFFLLTPLVSCSLGVAFLGDRISPQVAAGGALTMAGVALVALAERRETAATVAPEPG